MEFLPLFLRLSGRPALVVGGGEVAARKVALLLDAGAEVRVVAPELGTTLVAEVAAGRIRHVARHFAAADLDGADLVIAATDDVVVNAEVSRLARARSLPVNVVDNPALCSFIMPAIVDRSPVIVALSTGGASPVLARLLRGRLESLIPAAYGKLARLAAEFRSRVQQSVPEARRRAFWEDALQGAVADDVLAGREAEARARLEALLEAAGHAPADAVGEVYLVGGGPGDPELLTFRALRLMQQADVVVYDRLISDGVLALVRRDAERIYVGKARAEHTLPQEEINALLVRLARAGRRVLRLKGGDPFIFGRGGEEIDSLMAEGIPFQVVPGITAASGCAAYAGIPLTHREHAQSVTFVTGHPKRDGDLKLDWRSLAQPNQTVVFYMGVHGLAAIRAGLLGHGLAGSTPVAIVERGTQPDMRTHVSTLDEVGTLVEHTEIGPPALLIVGSVVTLRGRLDWRGQQAQGRGTAEAASH